MPGVPRRSLRRKPRSPDRLGLEDSIDPVEDSPMDNVVNLAADRPRQRRSAEVPQSGARILFFTGIRYCRDEAPTPCFAAIDYAASRAAASERVVDAAAH